MPNAFFIYLFVVVFTCSSTIAVSAEKRDNSIRMHLLKMHPFLKHKILSKSMRDLLFQSPDARRRRMDYLQDTVPLVTKSSFFWEEFNKEQQERLKANINEETTTEHSICSEDECSKSNVATRRDLPSRKSSKKHRKETTRSPATFQILQESDIVTSPSISSQHDNIQYVYQEITTKDPFEVENRGEVGQNAQTTTTGYDGDSGASLGSYNLEELNGKMIEGFTSIPNQEETQLTDEYEEPTSTQSSNLLDLKRNNGYGFQSAYVLPTEESFAETGEPSSSAVNNFGGVENQENNRENSNWQSVETILNGLNGTRNLPSSKNLPEATTGTNFEQKFDQNNSKGGNSGYVGNLDLINQNIKLGQNVSYGVYANAGKNQPDNAINPNIKLGQNVIGVSSVQNVSKSDQADKNQYQNPVDAVANSFLKSSITNFPSNVRPIAEIIYPNIETTAKSNLENSAATISTPTTLGTPTTSAVTNSTKTTLKRQTIVRNITPAATTKLQNKNVTPNIVNSALSDLVAIKGTHPVGPSAIPMFGSLKPSVKNSSEQDHDFSKVMHKTTSEFVSKSYNSQAPLSKLLIIPDYIYSPTYATTVKPWGHLNKQEKSPAIRSNDPDFVVDLAPDPNPSSKKTPSEIVIDDVETFPLKPKSEGKTSTGRPKLNLIQKLLHNVKGFMFPGSAGKSSTETPLGDHSKKRCANPKDDEDAVAKELVNVLKDVKSIKQEKCKNKTGNCELSGTWMSELAGRRVDIKADLTTKLKKNFLKRKWGFMGGGKWNATVRRPFPNNKNYVILVAVERSEKLIATFLGECMICRQREIIQGDWLFTRHSRDCESLGATSQLLGDVWRRDTLADVKDRVSQTTSTSTESSCSKNT